MSGLHRFPSFYLLVMENTYENVAIHQIYDKYIDAAYQGNSRHYH